MPVRENRGVTTYASITALDRLLDDSPGVRRRQRPGAWRGLRPGSQQLR
ncbi:hypothetical protein ACFQ2B_40390 [Streptomyces stramineus]